MTKEKYNKKLVREIIRALGLHVRYLREVTDHLQKQELFRRAQCRYSEYLHLRTILVGFIKSQM